MERDGAIAEVVSYLAENTPWPSRSLITHRLGVRAERTLRLVRTDLAHLGVDLERFQKRDYGRTADIGAAASFLDRDGLIVPSARWACDNLILFDRPDVLDAIEVIKSEPLDWRQWALKHGYTPETPI